MTCDSRELTLWEAYYGLDPWGEERADLRNGVAIAASVNLWRSKGQKASTPADWCPDFSGRKREPKTVEELRDAAKVMAQMFGGPGA